MDWLTFISKLVEALAWPIVALAAGLMFRKKLLEILPGLRKLKAGPVEAEFVLAAKQALADAEEASDQAAAAEPSADAESSTRAEDVVEKLREARIDPTGSILKGWSKLDGALFRLGDELGLGFTPLESTARVYTAVVSSGALPPQTVNLIRQLRDLRNQVAHAVVQPTVESAQDYLIAVERALELIDASRSPPLGESGAMQLPVQPSNAGRDS